MYAGYSAASFHAEHHVMRKSALGGQIWLNNTWIHSFALIVVGVSLRLAMQRGTARTTFAESWMLSGALVASFLLSQVTEFLHTLDGRVGGDSTWTSVKNHVTKSKGIVVLELSAVCVQALVPWYAVSSSLSAYDEVIVSAAITLFASLSLPELL